MKVNTEQKPHDAMMVILKEVFPTQDIVDYFGVSVGHINFANVSRWSREGLTGIQLRTVDAKYKTHLRQVMVKQGEIDTEALKSKFAELVSIYQKGQATRDEESIVRNQRIIVAQDLIKDSGISRPHCLVVKTPNTFLLTLCDLTREQVIRIGKCLKEPSEKGE